jgi:hypothetical protein
MGPRGFVRGNDLDAWRQLTAASLLRAAVQPCRTKWTADGKQASIGEHNIRRMAWRASSLRVRLTVLA